MTNLRHPLHSLKQGTWFKLICGASFQDLPAVHNLSLAYTLAGVDCIDVAADPAVVEAARGGITAAQAYVESARSRGLSPNPKPWLMVSLNDADDPHFRKAQFNPDDCPPDCPRPCEAVCPAAAIAFTEEHQGVIEERCYGCGRCLPICPQGLIGANAYRTSPETLAPFILSMAVDAIEIHTQPGHSQDFQALWRAIAPWRTHLKQLAISCLHSPQSLEYLRSLYDIIGDAFPEPIWQTDGRSMSGDIGKGTSKATIQFGQQVLAANLPGYVQLAGGTNQHTVPKLQSLGLFNNRLNCEQSSSNTPLTRPKPAKYIAGIAYGSYARAILSPMLTALNSIEQGCAMSSSVYLDQHPPLLWAAVERARSLVALHHQPSAILKAH
ncbi:circadian clock protein LdpA [Sodalinema gerasimenkoae]|uniref:circadian clock protein LdpA n=1 Tax=Sodalinema gerasimenkoae TaxID=2862348 RepID=UPI00135A54D6|nr:LdpA C-terminal domain-containing domain [Sodalinema gerasimenkoae]